MFGTINTSSMGTGTSAGTLIEHHPTRSTFRSTQWFRAREAVGENSRFAGRSEISRARANNSRCCHQRSRATVKQKSCGRFFLEQNSRLGWQIAQQAFPIPSRLETWCICKIVFSKYGSLLCFTGCLFSGRRLCLTFYLKMDSIPFFQGGSKMLWDKNFMTSSMMRSNQ
jgi:hypothetical protein